MNDRPISLVREGPGGRADSSELDVQVVPRASQSRVVGPHDGRLKVQLAAPPVDGAANAALIDLLADTLAVPRGHIKLLRGHTGKRKTLRIALAAAELRRRLGLLACLLVLAACESQYNFPMKVVLPDDQDELARAGEKQNIAFSAWLEPALKKAKDFYAQAAREGWSRQRILQERTELFASIQASYRTAFPEGKRYRLLASGKLNNAVLLSFGVYHQSSNIQQTLLDSVGRDLRSYINLYKQAQDRADGAEWLHRLAKEHQLTLPQAD
mgnify:CR=1 FL=1